MKFAFGSVSDRRTKKKKQVYLHDLGANPVVFGGDQNQTKTAHCMHGENCELRYGRISARVIGVIRLDPCMAAKKK